MGKALFLVYYVKTITAAKPHTRFFQFGSIIRAMPMYLVSKCHKPFAGQIGDSLVPTFTLIKHRAPLVRAAQLLRIPPHLRPPAVRTRLLDNRMCLHVLRR